MPFSEEDLSRLHDSLDRASANPKFLQYFYGSFLQISPEIREIFANTDMARLQRKLKSSLHLITLAVDGSPGADDYLKFLGRVHERFNIEPHHFQLWLDSLIGTLRDCDPEFDEAAEDVWRATVGEAIKLMRGEASTLEQEDPSA